MKKVLSLLLALAMLFSLCACGQDNNTMTTPANDSSETETESEAPTEPELTIEELKAIIATKALVEYADDTLRDPDSLSVLEITVVSSTPDGYHWVKIEYNANNGMGGKNRDKFYIETNGGAVTGSSEEEYFSDNDAVRMFRKGTNQGKYNEIVNGGAEEVEVDVDTVMNSLDLTDEELKNMIWKVLGIE